MDNVEYFQTVLVPICRASFDRVEMFVPRSIKKQFGHCEKCGREMVIRNGKFGKFVSCSGYPMCKNTKKYVD